MKKHLLIVIVSIICFLLCSFTNPGEEQKCCFPKEHFKDQSWYKPFLSLLTQENKIDNADAKMIKASSSDLRAALSEPIQQTIKKYGKVEEADITLMCNIKEKNDSIIYTFTKTLVYLNLFSYDPKINKLTRIDKKGVVVVTAGEELTLKENSDSLMVFLAQKKTKSENIGWTKYFCYNKTTQTFYHYKNCRTVDNKEECKIIQN